MGTISNWDMVKGIIDANGVYAPNGPGTRPDLIVKIVQYENMFNGGDAWGCIYEGQDLDAYHPSPSVIHPKTIWERKGPQLHERPIRKEHHGDVQSLDSD